MHIHTKTRLWLLISFVVLVLAGFGYGYYRYRLIYQAYLVQQGIIANLRTTIGDLRGNLSLTEYERDHLTNVLSETEQKAGVLQAQTTELAGTVDTLQKLTTIDPELLKKYSKVYFLNEHYTPDSLTKIDPRYISDKNRTLEIHGDVWPYLSNLLEAAEDEGLELRVGSSYRSFATQASLKSAYKITYGTTAANRFSAEQGYSEHQLGTTVDLTTVKTGTLTSSFDKSPEYAWLVKHAHKYGFVLSYPKNNKYYIYEPWHWRFVGVALATKLHDDGVFLYDLDQHDIDSYLIDIFE